jgi:hypothetical protein
MTDLDDFDHPSFIVHRVDDSIGTLADAIALRVSGQLLTPAWAGSLRETLNARNNADADGPGLNGFELLRRGLLDEDAIAGHAAEGP